MRIAIGVRRLWILWDRQGGNGIELDPIESGISLAGCPARLPKEAARIRVMNGKSPNAARFLFIKAWLSLNLLLLPANLLHSAGGTLTVATFNAEWLGYPRNSGTWYGSRSSQIQTAAADIIALGADIVALQEVVTDTLNGDALADLLTALNAQDSAGTWAGAYNPKFSFWWDPDFYNYPAQRQAFVWNTATVQLLSTQVLLDWIPAWDNRFGSGRLPYLLQVEVGEEPFRRVVSLINLHLKCCRGSDDRRLASMLTLLDELHDHYAEDALIVLGDFNVADRGGAYGEISEWGFYDDADNDGTPDFAHVAGAEADLSWSDIDHVMVSDELLPDWERVPVSLRNGTTASSVSDHSLVHAVLNFTPSLPEQYDQWRQAIISTNPQFARMDGFGEDWDQDRIANGLEFMLGTSPVERDASGSLLTIGLDESGYLSVSYRMRKGLPDGSLILGQSQGLASQPGWTPVDMTGPDVTVSQDPDPDFERVVLKGPAPAAPGSVFFRLEASLAD